MTDSRTDETAARLRGALLADMQRQGHALRPAVAAAFRDEPRHVYVPEIRRSVQVDGAWTTEVVDAGEPRWLELVYSDAALLVSPWPLPSSSTAPSLMADMLEALDPRPGSITVEIGTGTGYNAGLLGRLVGDDNVVTVDVNGELIGRARKALDVAGHDMVIAVQGDGAGLEMVRPGSVDRLIATCGVSDIPEAWIRAVRPLGRLVVPVGAGVVALNVDADGGARGKFLGTPAYFMDLRSAGGVEPTLRPETPDGPGEPCAMPFEGWWDDAFRFLVSLVLPSADLMSDRPSEDELIVWHRDGSIMRLVRDGNAQQAGPGRIGDVLGGLWEEHQERGRPGHDAYALTVSPAGVHAYEVVDQGGGVQRLVVG